ncbi:MAG: lytic murein transglycosylase [Bdellovibrionales bacterium]|nr:lytic murein transglycosylase [Bdellovibrionales bacterium]
MRITRTVGIISLMMLTFWATPMKLSAAPDVRGWDRLVDKLVEHGLERDHVETIFSDPKMPAYELVAFQLKPAEPSRIYSYFFKPRTIALAKTELQNYAEWFQSAEETYEVPREVIAGILLIETQFGRITGKRMVLGRLSRLANIGQADNINFNFKRHHANNKKVKREEVEARAQYLEDLFFPEVKALFEIAEERAIDIFGIVGSSAGAFGIPQFLPYSMQRFGVDANQNGQVSLFEMPDAIHSTANFLKQHGWVTKTKKTHKKAIYFYNRSDAYVNAVLTVASKVK